MELLIIAGFLGSGKTTIILSIARMLAEDGEKRVAIIENEAGEVGIDGRYLQMSGLMVQELYSGCVCCQLAGDLINTLDKVRERFNPQVTIVEPSGIARLENLLEVLENYAGKVDRMRTLSLVDILRFDTLMKVVSPLITSHVKAADLVALNKVENVEQAEIERVVREIKELNDGIEVIPVSAAREINLDNLFQRLSVSGDDLKV